MNRKGKKCRRPKFLMVFPLQHKQCRVFFRPTTDARRSVLEHRLGSIAGRRVTTRRSWRLQNLRCGHCWKCFCWAYPRGAPAKLWSWHVFFEWSYVYFCWHWRPLTDFDIYIYIYHGSWAAAPHVMTPITWHRFFLDTSLVLPQLFSEKVIKA